MKQIQFHDLGLMDYKECWDLQERIFNETVSDKLALRDGLSQKNPDHHLIFCEHPHVYTLGRSGDEKTRIHPDQKPASFIPRLG